MSIVRDNIMNREGYTPYCGGECSRMPRTKFVEGQFECPDCGWRSSFEREFIAAYLKRWKKP